jgi:hypothetical protein
LSADALTLPLVSAALLMRAPEWPMPLE